MSFTQKATPISSKTVYYNCDGTGRDSYIKTINGGLLTQDQLHALIPKKIELTDRMNFSKTKYRYKESSKVTQRLSNYQSDGSGRDKYICIDNGGSVELSHHWRNHPDFKFRDTLRTYNVIPHSFQRDTWQNLQQGFRNRRNNSMQLSAEKTTAKDQMNLTMRLSCTRERGNSFQQSSRPISAQITQLENNDQFHSSNNNNNKRTNRAYSFKASSETNK